MSLSHSLALSSLPYCENIWCVNVTPDLTSKVALKCLYFAPSCTTSAWIWMLQWHQILTCFCGEKKVIKHAKKMIKPLLHHIPFLHGLSVSSNSVFRNVDKYTASVLMLWQEKTGDATQPRPPLCCLAYCTSVFPADCACAFNSQPIHFVLGFFKLYTSIYLDNAQFKIFFKVVGANVSCGRFIIKDTVVFGEVLFVYQKNSHGTFNG